MKPTLELFSLEGRAAFVSGGAGWLGQSLVNALAGAGAHVVVGGLDAAKLESFVLAGRRSGMSLEGMPFDLRDPAAVAAAFDRIGERHGGLDVLVHNAHAGRPGTLDTATREDFAGAFDLAVAAGFECVRAARPALKSAAAARGSASVIHIASMYGMVSPDPAVYGETGRNNPPYYGAAKSGLLQLTRYLAVHLASDGIRVNAISPGPFPSPEATASAPKMVEQLRLKVPLRRIGRPEELAGAVVFLASAASSYVTGANLVVDGGFTVW